MAAVYLHNTLYGNASLENGHLPPHVRTTSTNSDATTVITSTDHSNPSQPLLGTSTSESAMFADATAQSQFPPLHYNRARDGTALQFGDKPVIPQQTARFRRHPEEARHQRLKVIYYLLEAIPPAWAIYNCVRYFVAYTIYNSGEGRTVSLVLGLLTGISFAFYACGFIIALFQRQLIRHHIPPRRIFVAEIALKALASAVLFAPSLISLVLLESWKNSDSSELNVLKRCHVDIDVVWSATKRQCTYSPWGVWLALSLLRVIVTLLFVVAYHATFFVYHRQLRRARPFQFRHRPRNLSESSHSSLPPVIPGPSLLGTPHRHHLQTLRNTSDSTLQSSSKISLSHPSPSNGRSFADEGPSGYSGLSEQEVKELFFPHDDSSVTLPGADSSNIDLENYHSLVSQVIRETEETMEICRSDTTSETDSAFSDHLDRPMYPANIGYDEFGRPYPPEFDVPVLNGLVRRMPTIESAGSREASSIISRPYSTDRETLTTRYSGGSRPSTRTGTLSFSEYDSGVHPPSRRNSAVAPAGEMGELLHSPGSNSRPITPGQTGFSYPSSGSYYTATSRRTAATTPLSFTAEPEEMEHTMSPPGLGVDELGRQLKR